MLGNRTLIVADASISHAVYSIHRFKLLAFFIISISLFFFFSISLSCGSDIVVVIFSHISACSPTLFVEDFLLVRGKKRTKAQSINFPIFSHHVLVALLTLYVCHCASVSRLKICHTFFAAGFLQLAVKCLSNRFITFNDHFSLVWPICVWNTIPLLLSIEPNEHDKPEMIF